MVWIFLAYLGILLLLGVVAKRQTRSLEGFLLGDRKMAPGSRRSRPSPPPTAAG